jgi:hypothetical protein
MASFSRNVEKPKTNGDGDNEALSEFNRYVFEECLKGKEKTMPNGKRRKEKQCIGRIGLIMDLGKPPAPDKLFESKVAHPAEGEDYSEEEKDIIRKQPWKDFVWSEEWDNDAGGRTTKRMESAKQFPKQEYGILLDFPDVLVDWTKHPVEALHKLGTKPLRVSLNGKMQQKFFKVITFDGGREGVISDKNLVYKICAAAGREQELLDSKFDIATAAEAMCLFNLTLDFDGTYLNSRASNPATVEDIEFDGEVVATAEQRIKKASEAPFADFVGILLDMDESTFTDEVLEMVAADTYGFIYRASLNKQERVQGKRKDGSEYDFMAGIDFDSTPFAKALEKFKNKKDKPTSKTSNPEKKEKVVSEVSKKEPIPEEVKETKVELSDEDYDDMIPF